MGIEEEIRITIGRLAQKLADSMAEGIAHGRMQERADISAWLRSRDSAECRRLGEEIAIGAHKAGAR